MLRLSRLSSIFFVRKILCMVVFSVFIDWRIVIFGCFFSIIIYSVLIILKEIRSNIRLVMV